MDFNTTEHCRTTCEDEHPLINAGKCDLCTLNVLRGYSVLMDQNKQLRSELEAIKKITRDKYENANKVFGLNLGGDNV